MKAVRLNLSKIPCITDGMQSIYNSTFSSDLINDSRYYMLNDGLIVRESEEKSIILPNGRSQKNYPIAIDKELLNLLKQKKFKFKNIDKNSFDLLQNLNIITPFDNKISNDNNKFILYDNFYSPFGAALEITGACQCCCDICPQDKKYKQDPSLDEINTRIKKLKDMGVVGLELLGGEPLIRKDINYIIENAQNNDMFIRLSTNGEYIKKHNLQDFNNIRKIRVSIDGFGDAHDKARNRKGLFAKAIDGVEFLYNKNVPIKITCVLSDKTIHSVPKLLYFLTDTFPDLQIGLNNLISAPNVKANRISPEQYARLYSEFKDVPQISFGGNKLERYEIEACFYGCMNAAIWINHNGFIKYCIINDASLSQKNLLSYRSEKHFLNERDKFRPNTNIQKCNSCHLRTKCSGPCVYSMQYMNMR